jgi:hypothetical protein
LTNFLGGRKTVNTTRKLYVYNWLGITITTVGLACVGIASVISDSGSLRLDLDLTQLASTETGLGLLHNRRQGHQGSDPGRRFDHFGTALQRHSDDHRRDLPQEAKCTSPPSCPLTARN